LLTAIVDLIECYNFEVDFVSAHSTLLIISNLIRELILSIWTCQPSQIKKVVNYKVLDPFKLYGFDIKFILLRSKMKSFEFSCAKKSITGGSSHHTVVIGVRDFTVHA
jgi:hypothetical protein